MITGTLNAIRERESRIRDKIALIAEQGIMESVDDRFNDIESLLVEETVQDYVEAARILNQLGGE